MNKQLSFKMPIVDGKRTKQEIEKVFNEYRRYLATMPCDMLPKVTASYSIVPPANTNEFNSSTENIAIERIEYEQERNKFMSWLYDGVNRLRDDEREVIVKFYMEHDSGYDQDIWMDLGIGKTKYYKLKGRAILRLAFNLKKEVFQKRVNKKRAKYMNIVQPIRDKEIIQEIKEFYKEQNERNYILFLLGINTGFRISDILRLRVRDVEGWNIVIREKKTRKIKDVKMPSELKRAIRNYTEGKPKNEYLIKSRNGKNKPITRAMAYVILNQAAEEFGLERIGTHSLRKTYGAPR